MRQTVRPWYSIRGLVAFVAGAILSLVGVASFVTPASASSFPTSSVTVTVKDFSFMPVSVKVGQGNHVEWKFMGPSNHTATDTSGMGLFNSGSHAPGSSYSFLFIAAGRYPYHCSIHSSMTGTVSVPIKVPGSGGVGMPFLVTWSSAKAPPGKVFDVQVKKPGATKFTAFRTGVTGRSARFTPSKAGTYRFRARVTRPGNHTASGYSPARSVAVT